MMTNIRYKIMNILITGGAGFIGTHLVRQLLAGGHEVIVLDSFHPQIHGEVPRDGVTSMGATVIRGSVADMPVLKSAALTAECIIHLAAETGTGQSMVEIERYGSANIVGTTNLAHLIANKALPKLRHVIVASSRAIYGEGKYRCREHHDVYPAARREERLRAGQFEPLCPFCGNAVSAVANDETTRKTPASFYGLTKQFQEECLLLISKVNGVSCHALRFQNVYGPGQSLRNPYTGVLTVFAKQAATGGEINVFEDGNETRDFVYVGDVVAAIELSIVNASGCEAYNVGSGIPTPMIEMANLINARFGAKARVRVSGDFRVGDIRHNYADIGRIKTALGFCPNVELERGVGAFCSWASDELKTM